MKRRFIIAGGSGFIGRALAAHFIARGREVVVLTRGHARDEGGARYVHWDGRTVGPWAEELDGADAVINLAGRNVNCRYTKRAMREMDESRVDSVNAIGAAIAECVVKPRVWVQASSTAIFGDAGERVCDESSPPGEGYPVRTCLQWEAAYHAMATPETRRVLLRMSFVLGKGGGALVTLARLTRCFLGGAVGTGRQYVSWVHLADLLRVFDHVLEHEVAGLYCATGPSPVTNAEFMGELRSALIRPWSPRTPAWAVHVGAFFMRTEAMLALKGRRVVPARLVREGFSFEYPNLRDALASIYLPARPDAVGGPRTAQPLPR